MAKSARKNDILEICDVDIMKAQPNPLFSEWQTFVTRFLRYSKSVPCSHCGKKSKHHWTSLVFFRVGDMETLAIKESEEVYAPLSPVCRKHPMLPQPPVMAPEGKEEASKL